VMWFELESDNSSSKFQRLQEAKPLAF